MLEVSHSHRLVSLIRSSPLWCSGPDLVSEERERSSRIEGLDYSWYYRRYREFLPPTASYDDCAEDYLSNVTQSARTPNMAFDEAWYRREYPDIDQSISAGRVRSGWEHYLREGARDLYNPIFWFNERWYRRQYGEAAQGVKNGTFASGFEHFLQIGISLDLLPSIYFNSPWYRSNFLNCDRGRHKWPLPEFLLARRELRHVPTPLFDAKWYAGQYLYSSRAGALNDYQAFEHYLSFGRRLGYSPSPHFNEMSYRTYYPEVNEKLLLGAYESGLEHYLAEGALNGLVAPRHISTAGIDYGAPAFVESYEKSLHLNIRQIARLRKVLEKCQKKI